ncbi:hypothetical protein CP97_07030 [Aurantiacibacter atlanticus]|uniref:Peptidase C-terminal archaeal/bacterial domain-containing protein n=1 Tax=Aurantiacibacter atlanticus TaxID=1648404 RepID=A0A0H4VXJ1_9SPHN|nr:hypothetical protein [Aurantiacibacter atlanticus]AKQ41828.1 hypothetical protein CP97_07030 [Aurantiacibacter atlanticus]
MRFGFQKTALLAGAAALIVPAGATAQAVNLDSQSGDVRAFQGNVDGAAATFEVTVPASSIMQIDVMTTSDLDPIVTVTDAATGEVIAEDDDGGGDLNSRVRIRGENGRRIMISVDSYDSTWVEAGEAYGGTFDLRLTTSAYTAPVTRVVGYGAREIGTIIGEPHEFIFTAQPGDTLEVALLAEGDLDPYLELKDAEGGSIAYNDDGGEMLNSLLVHTFESGGTYTILASAYGETEGDYTLRIREQRTHSAQLPLQVIGLDDEASGELASEWLENSLLPSSIDYQLSEQAKAAIMAGNGEVTIRMSAVEGDDPDFGGDLDSYIELGFETPLGFAVADSDDDGAGDRDAMLPVNLGLLASYPDMLDMLRIRVKGYSGSMGQYVVKISQGMEARAQGWEQGMEIPPTPAMSVPSN